MFSNFHKSHNTFFSRVDFFFLLVGTENVEEKHYEEAPGIVRFQIFLSWTLRLWKDLPEVFSKGDI